MFGVCFDLSCQSHRLSKKNTYTGCLTWMRHILKCSIFDARNIFTLIILMVEKWRNKILKPKNEAIDLCNPYWTPCICTTTDLIKNQDENLRPVLKVLWENQIPKEDNFLILFFLLIFDHWFVSICLEFTLITFVNNAWGLKICTFSKTVCP